jgi:hypothetical protein
MIYHGILLELRELPYELSSLGNITKLQAASSKMPLLAVLFDELHMLLGDVIFCLPAQKFRIPSTRYQLE